MNGDEPKAAFYWEQIWCSVWSHIKPTVCMCESGISLYSHVMYQHVSSLGFDISWAITGCHSHNGLLIDVQMRISPFWIGVLFALNVYRMEVILRCFRGAIRERPDKRRSTAEMCTYLLMAFRRYCCSHRISGFTHTSLLDFSLALIRKKRRSVQYIPITPELKMKGWITQRDTVSWHAVIKETELTPPRHFDTCGELFHRSVLSSIMTNGSSSVFAKPLHIFIYNMYNVAVLKLSHA